MPLAGEAREEALALWTWEREAAWRLTFLGFCLEIWLPFPLSRYKDRPCGTVQAHSQAGLVLSSVAPSFPGLTGHEGEE